MLAYENNFSSGIFPSQTTTERITAPSLLVREAREYTVIGGP